MKSSALPSWCYRNPEQIADGLIARTKRAELLAARKLAPVVRQRKDKHYTKSRSIDISSKVEFVKKNGGTR